MSYTQLTREQRYQIYALLKAGHNHTRIAGLMACHKSTISRELGRNRGHKGYRPKQADELAQARQERSHSARISSQTWAWVELRLCQQ
jgi:IS30 family transposase